SESQAWTRAVLWRSLAQAVPRLPLVRIERERLAVAHERIVVALHLHQHTAAVIVRVRVARADFERLIVASQGLFVAFGFGQSAGAIIDEFGVTGMKLQRLVKIGERRNRMTASALCNREQVKGVEKIGM